MISVFRVTFFIATSDMRIRQLTDIPVKRMTVSENRQIYPLFGTNT